MLKVSNLEMMSFQINISVKTSYEYFTQLHISYLLAPSLSFQSMTNSGLQADIIKSCCEKFALLENSLVKPNCALVVFCNLHREDKKGQFRLHYDMSVHSSIVTQEDKRELTFQLLSGRAMACEWSIWAFVIL